MCGLLSLDGNFYLHNIVLYLVYDGFIDWLIYNE